MDERAKVDEQAMANMAGKLADGLSKILTGAFQELERHIIGESRKISSSFEQQTRAAPGHRGEPHAIKGQCLSS